jgi:hypothetical protein
MKLPAQITQPLTSREHISGGGPTAATTQSGGALRRYRHSGAVAKQGPKLILRGHQDGHHALRSRALEHGLGQDVAARLHVDLFARLAQEPVVRADAVGFRIAGRHQRHVVDVGDRGHHRTAGLQESLSPDLAQVRHVAGIEVGGVEPVDADNNRGSCHATRALLPFSITPGLRCSDSQTTIE